MLSLAQTCKLMDVNPRVEFHGEEQKLAAGIKVSMDLSNLMLAEFHPLLRSYFYSKGNPAQDAFELGDDHRPHLVFPQIGTLKWVTDYANCDVEITSAVGVSVRLL